MKKNKRYNWIFPVFLLLFTGCNSFLDKAPDERLTINTLDKVEQTLVGAYQNSRGFRALDVSTDNVELSEGTTNQEIIMEDLYSWSQDFREQTHQDAPTSYWQAAYGAIANANQTLKSLDELHPGSEADIKKGNALKGEALIVRSYYEFILVNIFCKHYDPSTASADPGVPYPTEPETQMKVNYERGTVESTYAKAEEDLKNGIDLLEKNSDYFKTDKYRFTFPTVYLYASRFYTFRNKDNQDVKKAIDYANKAIKAFGGAQALRSWLSYDDLTSIDIYADEVGMVQNSYSWWAYPVSWVYGMTNEIRDKQLANPFGSFDLRFNTSYNASGNIFIPAFYFERDKTETNLEKSATDIFPMVEAFLNAAEGYVRDNDIPSALEMMKPLGIKVYYTGSVQGSTPFRPSLVTTDNIKNFYQTDEKNAVIQYILHERRAFFLYKGMRWFDIKRYHIDVTHKLENGTVLRLWEVTPNGTFQIPRAAIAAGIEPNK